MLKRIIFVCLIIIAFLYFDNTKEKESMVFEELVQDYYDVFTLEFDNLNTNNFMDYFSDDKVLKIYPKNNPIYKNKIESFIFNSINSNAYNIKRFINMYLNSVEGYYNEKEKYMLGGIPIKRVEVYASNDKINELINKFGQSITIIK